MQASKLPLLAFIGCGMVWGSTFLFIRMGNDSLPPLWACALRLALASLLLNAILLVTRTPWPKGPSLSAAAAFGFLEFGVSLPLLYYGERVVPSGLAAVIYAVCPIVAMFSARLMGMERLSPSRLAAALVALIGVAVIFWRELTAGGSAMGLLSVFLAAVSAPLAGLMLQRGPEQNAVGANAVGALVGFPFAALASFAIGEAHPVALTGSQLYPVVYLAVMGSVFAFVLFAWLVHQWNTTTVAFLGVIVPVIAVILGSIVRHESFKVGSLAGAAIVLVGVTVALRTKALAFEPA